MSHKFACQTCSLKLSVTDKVYDERIAGKCVSVRCRRCNSTIVITGDGRAGLALVRPPPPPPFPEPERELTPPGTTVETPSSQRSDRVVLGGTATSIGAGSSHGESIFSRRHRIAWKGVALLAVAAAGAGLAIGAMAGQLRHSSRAVVTAAPSGEAPTDLNTTAKSVDAMIASPELSSAQPSSTVTVPIVPVSNDVLNEGAIPEYVFKPAVIHLTAVAVHRAERCHPKGHAVGTARVFFTFSPSGRVTEAHIDGEPLASAPVAHCILDHALAIRMRKFDGAPFTVSLPITLR